MVETPVKTIHVKLKKSNSNINFVRTPTANISLTDRANPILSPTLSIQSTQKKVGSIDQRNSKQNVKKKSIKIKKKKTQSLDFFHKKSEKKLMSRISSQRKLMKKTSVTSFREERKVNIFDQTAMMLDINKKQSSRDWDNIIEDKKKELYAHLYKLDKKLLTFDQSYQKPKEIENGKKQMMDLIKKKCPSKINPNRKQLQPIHLNIYKVNRMNM